ncbi:MAG: 2'-deoxycytidine 5'-triphosphate deaminase [Myxococcota bacterium]
MPGHLGTLPSQAIAQLVASGVIRSTSGVNPERIQPASLDLTLGPRAWSMPGSVLPLAEEAVDVVVGRYARRPLDLSEPTTLERGQVYVVELEESLALPPDLAAYANGKSSIGRVDVQTRVLTDANPRYDKIPVGYTGPLYLEIIPKSFDLRVRAGDALNQAIFYCRRAVLDDEALAALAAETPLLYEAQAPVSGLGTGGLLMTLDLQQDIVGWVAKKTWRPLDLARLRAHDPRDFFEPIERPRDAALFLSREAFYIFSTVERVVVPPAYAVEMLPYDTSAGEFRAHYAGFFDPGFGWGVGGTPAVLEVRPYEDDLLVRHRQPVCKMSFERLTTVPTQLYGEGIKSHYARQVGPQLSKYFKEGC